MINERTKRLTRISLITAFTCSTGVFVIPIMGIPITFQLFFVLLSGMLLGSKDGFISQLLYILIGLTGFPVFAGGKGGFGIIASPTFGYIIGFPMAAYVAGKLKESHIINMIFLILALSIIYVTGLLYLVFYQNISFKHALSIGFFPFIWLDMIKIILAYIFYLKLKKYV